MYDYIPIGQHPAQPTLPPGLLGELPKDLRRKARMLRIRRERLLKRRLRTVAMWH